MSFMETYKRLDALCRDLCSADKGVTAYIECMDSCQVLRFRPESWQQDYNRLKHYRYIRNQIAHVSGATEEALCTVDDEQWLADFYQRILTEADPLARYRKASMKMLNRPAAAKKTAPLPPAASSRAAPAGKKRTGYAVAALLGIIITVLCFVAGVVLYCVFQ